MKNIYLSALIGALTMGQLYAQNQLAPHATSTSADWPVSMERLMKNTNYKWSDEPILKKSPVVSNPKNNSLLQLDSTILFYGYAGTQDSTPLLRAIHTYPEDNKEVIVDAQYNGFDWEQTGRNTLTYDDLDRIIFAFAETWDPTTLSWLPDSKIENFPHDDSPELADSLIVYSWDLETNGWRLILKAWNIYDNQDRYLEAYSTFDAFGEFLLFKDVYFYDANGDNTLIEKFLFFEDEEYQAGKEEMVYEEHLLMVATSYTADEFGSYHATNRTNYIYSFNDGMELIFYYEYDLEIQDWVLLQTDAYLYDSENRVTHFDTYTQDLELGGLASRELYTYEYVEGELIDYETYHAFDFVELAFYIAERTHYYYSEEGTTSVPQEPVNILPLAIVPNPTTDFVELTLDAKATVLLFDQNGRLLQTLNTNPGRTMVDLNNLPAGVYQLIARTDKEQYNGRVLKQ